MTRSITSWTASCPQTDGPACPNLGRGRSSTVPRSGERIKSATPEVTIPESVAHAESGADASTGRGTGIQPSTSVHRRFRRDSVILTLSYFDLSSQYSVTQPRSMFQVGPKRGEWDCDRSRRPDSQRLSEEAPDPSATRLPHQPRGQRRARTRAACPLSPPGKCPCEGAGR
jgi:hypothetical protein